MKTRQQLIEDNLGIVHSVILKKYPTYAYDEDILQSGMLGLCKAAEKWDSNKSKFSTFAWSTIVNEIRYELRKRERHKGILSLDYEVTGEDGKPTSFGDFIVGDEDVNYVDLGVDTSLLTPREQHIFTLYQNGVPPREIGERLNISHEKVGRAIRKIKSMRGYANED